MAGNSLVRHQLAMARDALATGDTRTVRTAAHEALARATPAKDKASQALASLLLAQALMHESRMQWAHRFASTAERMFRELQDPAGISDSLLTLSYLASSLARDDTALRAASDVLAGTGGIERRGAAGLNYYGVAAFWARDYGTARGVLDAACRLSTEECGTVAVSFQPLANACFTEVLRCSDAQHAAGRADYTALADLVAQTRRLARAGSVGRLTSGPAQLGLLLLEFESCFLACRTGRQAEADRFYQACVDRARDLPASQWMQGLVHWARMEVAGASGCGDAAIDAADAMLALAGAGEHRRFAAQAALLHAQTQQRFPSRRGARIH